MARSKGRDVFKRAESGGHGGIAAEEDAIAAGLDGVAVVAAIGIAAHAGAPVLHLEGADLERSDARAFAPAEFVNRAVAADTQQIRRARRGDHGGAAAFQAAQAADVEMVHVRVREQDDVDLRQLGDGERGLHQALEAERHRAHADAGARAEDRVGEDRNAIDLEQHGGVAEPGGVQTGIGPELRMRAVGRGQNLAFEVCEPMQRRFICLVRCGVRFSGCGILMVGYIDGVATGQRSAAVGDPRSRLRGAVFRHRVRVHAGCWCGWADI